MKNLVKIVSYEEKFREDFKKINVEWLEDMFVVEPYDLDVLSNPHKYILSKGGDIWIALNSDEVVGTCALIEHEKGHYELTKMGVSKKARGLGAGRALLKFTIGEAIKREAKSLFLLTNKACESAIFLYREEGFVDDLDIESRYGAYYDRCNLGMLYKGAKKA